MATENLFTNGSEFKLPNGRRYRGSYHIHPTKGAMVGAKHVNRYHEVLQPINKNVNKKIERFVSRSAQRSASPPRTPVVPPPVRQTVRPQTQRPPRTTRPSGGY